MRAAALCLAVAAALCLCGAPAAAPRGRASALLPQVTLRLRVIEMTPREPVRFHWRWGGEGLGGDVVSGIFPVVSPKTLQAPSSQEFVAGTGRKDSDDKALFDDLDGRAGPIREEKDYFIEKGRLSDTYWLKPGVWTWPVPMTEFRRSGGTFLTVTLEGMKSRGASRGTLKQIVVEFEVAQGGRTLKTFTEAGPDGPTVGIYLPLHRLGVAETPDQAFLAETTGLAAYADRRVAWLEALPWASLPLPRRTAFVTDCYGYGAGAGYGIRTTNRQTLLNEFRALRQIGVNGLRGAPGFASEMIRAREGIGAEFTRVRLSHGIGYPVPGFDPDAPDATAGCPFHPSRPNLAENVRAAAARLMDETVRKTPVEEYWFLTVDEIGSVFDRTPERKSHMGCCPHCRKAFRDYVQKLGYGLADFGAADWEAVRPVWGYWDIPYAEKKAAETAAKTAESARQEREALAKALEVAPSRTPPATTQPRETAPAEADDPDANVVDQGDDEAPARRASTARRNTSVAPPPPIPLPESGRALLTYCTRRFNNDVSASMFAPQRRYFEEQNARKKQALAEGRPDSPEARQPWVYSYSLRGNTFLMGGASLDFFDFYRQADNGFMYETSNRDARVWQWDSYLCAVGATIEGRLNSRFGIYVKPHRGAPIQRALTAVAHGCKVIFWYTYGPNWTKGDSFSASPTALAATSRAARLIGAAEEALYGARPAVPARIAVVRPLTSEYFENNASWENGKWVYAALMHAHLPVDALDEGLIESEDLGAYKVIYVSGTHLRRASAEKLAAWVAQGGVLYTSAGGLSRDEAGRPLAALQPALGLASRPPLEMWSSVSRYGAVSLASFHPLQKDKPLPPEAALRGEGDLAGEFSLAVGREPLDPGPGAQVLARFADGKPALTRHPWQKGAAYVAGFYPGLEYSADILKPGYDMSRDFSPAKRACIAAPALRAGVEPPVLLDAPCSEVIYLRHPVSGARAVVLLNWAYKAANSNDTMSGRPDSPLEFPGARTLLALVEQPAVTIRNAGAVKAVRSAWSGEQMPFERRGDDVVIRLPRLEEAEVLVLE